MSVSEPINNLILKITCNVVGEEPMQSYIIFDNKNCSYNIYFYDSKDKFTTFACKYDLNEDIDTIIYLINKLNYSVKSTLFDYALYSLSSPMINTILKDKDTNANDINNYVTAFVGQQNTLCSIIEKKDSCRINGDYTFKIERRYLNMLRIVRLTHLETNSNFIKYNSKVDENDANVKPANNNINTWNVNL